MPVVKIKDRRQWTVDCRPLTQEKVTKILEILEKLHAVPTPKLNFETPFQLLIACILSAQCTDTLVNRITQNLFKKYPNPQDFLQLTQEALEKEIRSCNYYRTKARHILATCQILVEKFQGKVPQDRETLMQLPGVGRKCANVVLAFSMGAETIPVDTHVFRVANRLGLAKGRDPLETEEDLMKNLPKEKWVMAHPWLIDHGRRICKAQKPKCEICDLKAYCDYYAKTLKTG